MKTYRVVEPDLIDPNDILGIQEPKVDSGIRDLVNVDDEDDRILANNDDFPEIGEIVTEDDFYMKRCHYIDEQGNLGDAPFAYRK